MVASSGCTACSRVNELAANRHSQVVTTKGAVSVGSPTGASTVPNMPSTTTLTAAATAANSAER